MIVRTKGIKWFFLILLCFLYIYNPAFSPISTMHFVAGISILIIATKLGKAKQIVNVVSPAICLLILMLFYRVIIVLTSRATILSAVFDPLVMILELIPSSIAIVLVAKDENYSLEGVITGAVLLQDVLAIAAMFLPGFKNAIISIMLRSGYNEIVSFMQRHRMYGFSYTMPYGLPVAQSCIAVMFLFNALRRKNTIANLLMFLLTSISAVLNARISLGIIGIGITFTLLYAVFSKRVLNPKIGFIAVITIAAISIGINVLSELMPATFVWLQEGIDDILNALTRQDYGRTSYMAYATNIDNYRLPDGWKIFFGTGQITRDNAVYNSDVGYINDIWLGGMIYLTMVFSLGMHMLKRIYRSFSTKYKENGECFFRISFLIVALLVANIKGRVFYENEIMNTIFLVYVWASLSSISSRIYKTCQQEN